MNLEKLGERTVWIDCDVIRADGGTRTASITGAMVALALALKKLKAQKVIPQIPLNDFVAAISVGIIGKETLLDLDYAEDSSAEVDMNVVMTGSGRFVELQATAEGEPFSNDDLDRLIGLARPAIQGLVEIQKSIAKLDVPASAT